MATKPQSTSQGYPPSKQVLGERRVYGTETIGPSLPSKKPQVQPFWVCGLGSLDANLKIGRRGVRIHSNVADLQMDEGVDADKDETVNSEERRKPK